MSNTPKEGLVGGGSNDNNDEDDHTRVVLEQTLFKTDEAFIYRIPPMMTSGGHHASDWDLANPVATCSVHVLRRDSDLLIKLLANKPKPNGPPGATEKYLFAQSKISLDFSSSSSSQSSSSDGNDTKDAKKEANLKIEHWIETVTDSSRYFVIRISDEKRKKEAHVGMGFRERNDSMNFKMSLQDYENTMRKEAMIGGDDAFGSGGSDNAAAVVEQSESEVSSDTSSSISSSAIEAAVSKLSLKEGEKIHINLKGNSSSSTSASKNRTKNTISTQNASLSEGGKSHSKPPMLLRKPPPPASSSGVRLPPTTMPNVVINTDALKMKSNKDGDGDVDGGAHHTDSSCVSSVAAVAETTELGDSDSDDEWGDFESPSFTE